MKSKYQSEYRLSRLIAKMLLKEISEEENLELQAWLKSSPENRERLEIWKQRLICDMQVLSLGNKDRVWKNIQREISGKHSLCRWNYQKIAAYAAVCLLLVGCTGLLMWLATGETYIRPGYSQALLSVTGL
ncbi:MAG: hypothetical protein IJ494_09930 [Bacteroides sp.]|nr:hypothetical protein [Bacteroides sp.]